MQLLAQHVQAAMPWWVWMAIIFGVLMVFGRACGKNCNTRSARAPFAWLGLVALIAVPTLFFTYLGRHQVATEVRREQTANQLDDLSAQLEQLRRRRIEIEHRTHTDHQLISAESAVATAESSHAELQPPPVALPAEQAPEAPRPQPAQPAPAALPSVPDSPAYASPAWLEADGVFLIADVYPSPAAAARGLAARLTDLSRHVLAEGDNPRRITIQSSDSTLTEPFIDTVTDRIEGVETRIVTEHPAEPAPGEILVHLSNAAADRAGQATLLARGSAGDRTRTADWADKPWVDRFAAFQSQNPGDWVVAQSQAPALGADEAVNAALWDASGKLTGLISRQLVMQEVAVRNTTPIKELVDQALASGAGVHDRFVQRFDRPSGSVWRAVVLIDAADPAFAAIPGIYRQERASLFWQIGSGVILLAVVIGLYFLLNAATKGYYEGVLRLAGVALVAAVIFVLVLWLR